jgi:hypothetical protein
MGSGTPGIAQHSISNILLARSGHNRPLARRRRPRRLSASLTNCSSPQQLPFQLNSFAQCLFTEDLLFTKAHKAIETSYSSVHSLVHAQLNYKRIVFSLATKTHSLLVYYSQLISWWCHIAHGYNYHTTRHDTTRCITTARPPADCLEHNSHEFS